MASEGEHERYMQMALEEAAAAVEVGDHPFGGVLVKDGEVLALGRNMVETTFDITAHGETMALRNAGQAHRRVEFPGSTLYASMEPCAICVVAMIQAKVSTLVMGARAGGREPAAQGYSVERLLTLGGWEDQLTVITGVMVDECLAAVADWRRPRS